MGRVASELNISNKMIATFVRTAREIVDQVHPLTLPQHCRNPSKWPSTRMDELWQQSVADETELDIGGDLPVELTREERHLVKPAWSLEDPLLVLSSYPTMDSLRTVHTSYGTSNDLSKMCMATMYMKLGFHNTSRTIVMLHVGVFPRRFDRKAMTGRPCFAKLLDQSRHRMHRVIISTSRHCARPLRCRPQHGLQEQRPRPLLWVRRASSFTST